MSEDPSWPRASTWLGAYEPGSRVDLAVVGVPDRDFGQRLQAFVVRRPGSTLTEEAVQEHVKANLARFKVPREVAFMDELPRNATGKILKRELQVGA